RPARGTGAGWCCSGPRRPGWWCSLVLLGGERGRREVHPGVDVVLPGRGGRGVVLHPRDGAPGGRPRGAVRVLRRHPPCEGGGPLEAVREGLPGGGVDEDPVPEGHT